jgi:hypothetical protein
VLPIDGNKSYAPIVSKVSAERDIGNREENVGFTALCSSIWHRCEKELDRKIGKSCLINKLLFMFPASSPMSYNHYKALF